MEHGYIYIVLGIGIIVISIGLHVIKSLMVVTEDERLKKSLRIEEEQRVTRPRARYYHQFSSPETPMAIVQDNVSKKVLKQNTEIAKPKMISKTSKVASRNENDGIIHRKKVSEVDEAVPIRMAPIPPMKIDPISEIPLTRKRTKRQIILTNDDSFDQHADPYRHEDPDPMLIEDDPPEQQDEMERKNSFFPPKHSYADEANLLSMRNSDSVLRKRKHESHSHDEIKRRKTVKNDKKEDCFEESKLTGVKRPVPPGKVRVKKLRKIGQDKRIFQYSAFKSTQHTTLKYLSLDPDHENVSIRVLRYIKEHKPCALDETMIDSETEGSTTQDGSSRSKISNFPMIRRKKFQIIEPKSLSQASRLLLSDQDIKNHEKRTSELINSAITYSKENRSTSTDSSAIEVSENKASELKKPDEDNGKQNETKGANSTSNLFSVLQDKSSSGVPSQTSKLTINSPGKEIGESKESKALPENRKDDTDAKGSAFSFTTQQKSEKTVLSQNFPQKPGLDRIESKKEVQIPIFSASTQNTKEKPKNQGLHLNTSYPLEPPKKPENLKTKFSFPSNQPAEHASMPAQELNMQSQRPIQQSSENFSFTTISQDPTAKSSLTSQNTTAPGFSFLEGSSSKENHKESIFSNPNQPSSFPMTNNQPSSFPRTNPESTSIQNAAESFSFVTGSSPQADVSLSQSKPASSFSFMTNDSNENLFSQQKKRSNKKFPKSTYKGFQTPKKPFHKKPQSNHQRKRQSGKSGKRQSGKSFF